MSYHMGQTRPTQLGYLDDSEIPTRVVMLDHYVSHANDLAYIEKGIRARRWGSIAFDKFFIRVYTHYNITQDPSFDGLYQDVKLYGAAGFQANTPATLTIQNMLLGA